MLLKIFKKSLRKKPLQVGIDQSLNFEAKNEVVSSVDKAIFEPAFALKQVQQGSIEMLLMFLFIKRLMKCTGTSRSRKINFLKKLAKLFILSSKKTTIIKPAEKTPDVTDNSLNMSLSTISLAHSHDESTLVQAVVNDDDKAEASFDASKSEEFMNQPDVSNKELITSINDAIMVSFPENHITAGHNTDACEMEFNIEPNVCTALMSSSSDSLSGNDLPTPVNSSSELSSMFAEECMNSPVCDYKALFNNIKFKAPRKKHQGIKKMFGKFGKTLKNMVKKNKRTACIKLPTYDDLIAVSTENDNFVAVSTEDDNFIAVSTENGNDNHSLVSFQEASFEEKQASLIFSESCMSEETNASEESWDLYRECNYRKDPTYPALIDHYRECLGFYMDSVGSQEYAKIFKDINEEALNFQEELKNKLELMDGSRTVDVPYCCDLEDQLLINSLRFRRYPPPKSLKSPVATKPYLILNNQQFTQDAQTNAEEVIEREQLIKESNTIDINDIVSYRTNVSILSSITDFDIKWQEQFKREMNNKESIDEIIKSISLALYNIIKYNHEWNELNSNPVYGSHNMEISSNSPNYDIFTPITQPEDIFHQFKSIYDCCDEFNVEHSIISYIYITRMLNLSNQKLNDFNWKNIVAVAMLSSLKFWDDSSMYTADFVGIFNNIDMERIKNIHNRSEVQLFYQMH
ncbi:uncharacterized protein BX663DRAFT_587527 [Cokeromyces recurvatus]|uniref:uncharacterized protein n=1 Tax=Cokeromyces recurvatus TaxID=90255 RepID=UPI00221F922D|nr:uncharacterized protein BX663DRAFT_587527 [Cokeromyces recurvatus]KAI7903836.1 hypothetical protein BX663DRAFT_587527 [Cokeromyces recurvatus]